MMESKQLIVTSTSLVLGMSVMVGGVSTTHAQVPPDEVPVRIPANYDPDTPAPLIVALHGYTGSGDDASSSLFNIWPQASQSGFLYVSPTGSRDFLGNNYWNATDACCDFFNIGIDHVAYIREMIESIQSEYSVDPNQIHLIGHSNGGFMCHAMACAHPEMIASITAVAGSGYADQADCQASEPVHVLQVHGTADDVIAYDGGWIIGVPYPGAWETVEDWAVNNDCGPLDPAVVDTLNVDGAVGGYETKVRVAIDCQAGGSAQLWSLEGSSHGPSVTNAGREAILQYMLDHPKNEQNGCLGDVDGNLSVGIDDLLLVLSAFGQSGDHPEDVNGDQVVDVDDLTDCIASFGLSC